MFNLSYEKYGLSELNINKNILREKDKKNLMQQKVTSPRKN